MRATSVGALGDDVGRAEFARELLTRFVSAHRDDALRAHLLGGKDRERTDCAVTDDHDVRARLHARRVGGEPAGAEDVGRRQHVRDHLRRGDLARRDERDVGEGHSQYGCLCAADELTMLAGGTCCRTRRRNQRRTDPA
jgi:hypothetical protein